MRGRKLAVILCTAALAATPVAAMASTANGLPTQARSYDVTFVKHLTDRASFTFGGVTGGAARGQLTSQLIGQTAPATDKYQFIEFRWTVTAGEHSFIAVTAGTLNLTTGEVAMTGTVTDGWHNGADVLEKGELTDPVTETFAGDIVLLVR
jgi:hypothetical protein